MNQQLHLVVHYLDVLRHELAATFTWHAVQTNIGAWPWQAALAGVLLGIFYPPVRRAWHREWDHLHAKLDHIIDNHPDIPALPSHIPRGRPWSRKKDLTPKQ